jgi:hypothetical protein
MAMKKLITLLLFCSLGLLAQQPQSSTAPTVPENAQWVNGVAPGYRLMKGSGFTLNVGVGSVSNCNGSPVIYTGGTLTMAGSTTNNVYLNTASSCVPASKTTATTCADVILAVVTTNGSGITAISDYRGPFSYCPSSSGLSSVGLTMPPEFAIANSPLTSNGTIGVTKNNQGYGTIWRTPDAGTAAEPIARNPTPIKHHVNSTSGPFTITLDSTSLAGELIVPVVFWTQAGAAISITDNESQGPYTQDVVSNSGGDSAIYHFVNSVAGVTTLTFTITSGPASDFDIVVYQISSAAASSVLETSASSTYTGCSSGVVSLPSVTIANPMDIIISAGKENSGETLSAGLGSVFGGQFSDPVYAGTYYPAVQSWSVNSANTYTPTMICTANNLYGNVTAAYKGLVGAPSQQPGFYPPTAALTAEVGVGPLYNTAGTPITATNVHWVYGTCTLGTSCSITLTGAAVYTGATQYRCSATDETSAAAVKFAPSSGSAFALTGTGTDVLSFICAGY